MLKTLQTLKDSNTLITTIETIIHTELPESGVNSFDTDEGNNISFYIQTDVGILSFSCPKNTDLEYFEFLLLTELQDEMGIHTLKEGYEKMYEYEIENSMADIRFCKTRKEFTNVLNSMDTMTKDLLINGKDRDEIVTLIGNYSKEEN